MLHVRDTIIRVGDLSCPETFSKLRDTLSGPIASSVELTVQMAGSSSEEGVRRIKIERSLPKATPQSEVRDCNFYVEKDSIYIHWHSQVAAAVFAKLLKDAAAAGDDEMAESLHAQMRAEREDFV
jgi:hypothetical protein